MIWQPIETAPKDGTAIDIWLIPEHGLPNRQPDARWVNRDPLDPENNTGCEGFWCPMLEKFAQEVGEAVYWLPVPDQPK